MNIESILIQATQKLQQANIKNPHLEAEILLSDILKKPREFILAHPNYKLANSQITNFKLQISRRIKGMPLAYIIGHKEFYGLDFRVNKNVLIPRPETELMVEEALKRITRNMERITLIDVGTGSGCIIIALVKCLKSKFQISNFKFLATDISKSALIIARKNAKVHKVNKKIKFLHGSLLKPIINKSKIPALYRTCSGSGLNLKSKIIITANLPYLTPAQIKNSPTIQYEPKLALSAGPDGLKYYCQLFKQIKILLNSNKLTPNSQIFAMLEINPSQTLKMKQLAKNTLPQCKYEIKKDLKGHNRLVIIEINNTELTRLNYN